MNEMVGGMVSNHMEIHLKDLNERLNQIGTGMEIPSITGASKGLKDHYLESMQYFNQSVKALE